MKLTPDDDKKLRYLYITEKMSSTELAKRFEVSHRTILNHLDKMGVERRNLEESHFASNKKEYPIEFSDYEYMYNLYVVEHNTKEQIGKMFNCAPHVIDRVLKKLHIHVRDASEAKIGVQKGKSHHNWKGGISSLNSRCREFFQKNISPKVRERDGYRCVLCGCKSNLHVHHIIPFSSIIEEIISEHPELDVENDTELLYEIIVSDERFLNQENLITYCKECHLFVIHKYTKTISN